MHDSTGSLPGTQVDASAWAVVLKQERFSSQLQVAWVQGRYEAMWRGCLLAQIDGRYFPIATTIFVVIALLEKLIAACSCFSSYITERQVNFGGSISNLFFMVLGCDQLPQRFLNSLVVHLND